MDPEERRDQKRHKEYYNMVGFLADSEFGIPKRCHCGSKIIDEVRGNKDYDTLPGKRFFQCSNYEDDGLHYRHPWVFGVQEELESLSKRVTEAEKVITEVASLQRLISTLEEQVRILSEQVADLEKICFK